MKLSIILNPQRRNRIDMRFLFLTAGHIESYRAGLAAGRKKFRREREGYQIQQRREEGIGKIIEKPRHGEIMLVNSRDLCINYIMTVICIYRYRHLPDRDLCGK